MTVDISSLQNPRVKHIVKLREDRRQRREDGLMLVEGWTELQHALAAGMAPQTVFTAPELVTRRLETPAAELLTVSPAVFKKMSYRENPDGWLGVFPIPDRSLDDLSLASVPLVIVAEAVEKPGNLGAILRTADAAGVDALLVSDPRVDLWNPNVVRASRGALFSVPSLEAENAGVLAWLRSRQIQVLAATPSAQRFYTEVDMTGPSAIVVGTEDEGLSDFWLDNADQKVLIPMRGRVNSLNVSIAAALLVYEAVRQRADHV
jgi:TrmH family RNA methyltransferase